ncbi:FAD-binding oxidoreductase [Paroceanicella profunda]|uniref:FAD-binding oxidoreductase n=1 Tax=Paroceanicella profunda TaxID=2579971 RepID=A0A5B8FRN3_9RHOB|nr:FAD-binding oxidoreductase [Paroceanicella profunda]QDL91015.1 FAD-binding oxidoreductase [Paroceanicella profunda]
MADILVLGAGMAGLGAALQLQRRGRDVALVDRRPPGRETSYGNAGIIQAEAMEPYAMPRGMAALLRIARGRDNSVHFHAGALPGHFGPLMRYWWHSGPSRHARATQAYSGLIARATQEHESLIEEAGAAALVRREGFRELYRDESAFTAAAGLAEGLAARFGLKVSVLDAETLRAAEPALRNGGVGAVHWRDPWTVSDPGGLVTAYAELFAARGGQFSEGDAATLAPRPGGGWRVETIDGPLEAEAAVVALGPWSPALLGPMGYKVPMLRKRGYHMHYRAPIRLNLPLLDAANGYVMAPMAKGLRITTGAELAGAEASSSPVQLRRAERLAGELLTLGAPVENAAWMGTRPCMPDMLPVVGPAPRHRNLWFHFGHGHQGFTLGPTTGRLLAEMVAGETPFTDPGPFSPSRLD